MSPREHGLPGSARRAAMTRPLAVDLTRVDLELRRQHRVTLLRAVLWFVSVRDEY